MSATALYEKVFGILKVFAPSSVHRRVHSDLRALKVRATKWLGTLVLQPAGSGFQPSAVSL